MRNAEPYWYLASYPKSGNTWCRAFISELHRLAGLDQPGDNADPHSRGRELRLNRDLTTGSIMSSRHGLDDQLGVDSSDLRWAEIDPLRGRVGHVRALYAESLRYHKVHDAFTSPDSGGQPVVPVEGCRGAVVLVRHPADVAVSLSHFFAWNMERSLAFLLDREAALCRSSQRGGEQVRQYLGTWEGHVRSWVDQRQIPVLLLRFEDLLTQPNTAFARLARFLALPAEEGLLAQAVANTRFEKLRAKEEEEAGFCERPQGCARFFRSGRSGEGQEQLSGDQLAELRAAFAVTLCQLGYGHEATRDGALPRLEDNPSHRFNDT